MFEREIKFIYDFNLNKVNRLGPYFTFEQLSRVDIHPAILNYISAEIDFLIFEDRQNLLKNSVFDYSGEKISNYFNLISDEVKKSKRFSLEYISKLILHASSFTVNYLVRPKWTLSKFVFDESDHKTTLEIKQILNYIYYYQYLKKILISYINSKKIISMNSDEFISLLDRVDKLGIETYLPSILSNALKSMGDFFNIGEIQKNKIPFLAIEKFLEEKNLEHHLNKIHSIFGTDITTKVNILDLQKTLESVMLEKYEHHPEKVIEEEEIKEEISPVKEPEIIDEKMDEALIEDYEEESTTSDESINDEIANPQKLRIRIDKNNEIESIADDEDSKTSPIEEYIGENDSATNETTEELYDSNSGFDQYVDENEEILEEESEIEKEETFEGYEHKSEDVTLKTNELEDLIEENSIIEPEKVSDDEIINPDQIENATSEISFSDNENDLSNEEEETEESMLKSILKGGEDESDESLETDKDDLSKDTNKQKIDVAELLEHKEMTKIIEVIFDYDIEEFANTLDEISSCQSYDDAVVVINQALRNRNLSSSSKEAESFKSIISQYFTE